MAILTLAETKKKCRELFGHLPREGYEMKLSLGVQSVQEYADSQGRPWIIGGSHKQFGMQLVTRQRRVDLYLVNRGGTFELREHHSGPFERVDA